MGLRESGGDKADDFFPISFKPCVNSEEDHAWGNGS